jgi:hypothetical protein
MGTLREMEVRGRWLVREHCWLWERRYIEALEKREISLEGKKEILIEKIQRLERVLARLGLTLYSK